VELKKKGLSLEQIKETFEHNPPELTKSQRPAPPPVEVVKDEKTGEEKTIDPLTERPPVKTIISPSGKLNAPLWDTAKGNLSQRQKYLLISSATGVPWTTLDYWHRMAYIDLAAPDVAARVEVIKAARDQGEDLASIIRKLPPLGEHVKRIGMYAKGSPPKQSRARVRCGLGHASVKIGEIAKATGVPRAVIDNYWKNGYIDIDAPGTAERVNELRRLTSNRGMWMRDAIASLPPLDEDAIMRRHPQYKEPPERIKTTASAPETTQPEEPPQVEQDKEATSQESPKPTETGAVSILHQRFITTPERETELAAAREEDRLERQQSTFLRFVQDAAQIRTARTSGALGQSTYEAMLIMMVERLLDGKG
jgi:hypothetical protein